mmetsp:Transcript_11390/g.27323  ORF Transcript_11390/g.27323 Transcript_11390/m.27323 type:complete len:256 (-) Transcript_11390:19-786(-)
MADGVDSQANDRQSGHAADEPPQDFPLPGPRTRLELQVEAEREENDQLLNAVRDWEKIDGLHRLSLQNAGEGVPHRGIPGIQGGVGLSISHHVARRRNGTVPCKAAAEVDAIKGGTAVSRKPFAARVVTARRTVGLLRGQTIHIEFHGHCQRSHLGAVLPCIFRWTQLEGPILRLPVRAQGLLSCLEGIHGFAPGGDDLAYPQRWRLLAGRLGSARLVLRHSKAYLCSRQDSADGEHDGLWNQELPCRHDRHRPA